MSQLEANLSGGEGFDKGHWIEDLKPGLTVKGVFAVSRAAARPKKDGSSFLSLELQDRTGRMTAVAWEHAHLAPQLGRGAVVRVSGVVDTFQERPQVKVARMELVSEDVPPELFLPAGHQERELLESRMADVRSKVETPYLKAILAKVFDEDQLLGSYLTAPAAKLRHQAYVGGLAEHSLNMAEHALYCAGFYPELDRDLLVVATLFHDIGKIFEFRVDTSIDYSDEGRLVGHIVIGERLVRQAADSIADFPEEVKMHLSHLILSHQGRLEYGSPVKPQSLEAVVLYALDLLDSRVATFLDIRDSHKGEDRTWSDYDRLDDRFWYLKGGVS